LDFGPLTLAIARLTVAAQAYDAALRATLGAPLLPPAARLSKVDALVMHTERDLLDARGLPGRPWYRHEIYAPGIETGYSAKTMPMIREGIELHRWSDARAGIGIVSSALDRYTATLREATQLLHG
jgi:N-acetylated-alpha-linked acidic dipeptidase